MNHLVRHLTDEFEDLIDYKVTHVAWEIVPSFGQMNQRELVQATATTLKVITFQHKLPYIHFTPMNWHKQLIGKGKCTKDEVKTWILDNVVLQFDKELPDNLPYDVYDAIGIGQVAYRRNEWITNEFEQGITEGP